MTDKILALFVAGILHIWNPTGQSQKVTLQIAGNVVVYTAAPLAELTLPSNISNQVVTITASSDIKAWFSAQEVPFEALKPAVRWEIPVHKGTGIVIANSNGIPAILTFSINGLFTDAQLVENTSFGLFVSDLFGRDMEGTLVITSGLTDPITVAATQCNKVCQALPTSN